jgi:hypothetical protein
MNTEATQANSPSTSRDARATTQTSSDGHIKEPLHHDRLAQHPVWDENRLISLDTVAEDRDLPTAAQGLVTALRQLKANSSRVRRPHSQSASAYQIDEVLWAAYRRYDRSALTEKLLRHYLPGLALMPELSASRDPGRESACSEFIAGRSESRSGHRTCTQTTSTHAKHLLRLTSKPGKDKHEIAGLKISC